MTRSPVWFARFLGRQSKAQSQTNTSTEEKTAEEEERRIGQRGGLSRAENCLDTFFREQENERAMLAAKFYRDRYWKMVAANQRWSNMPLSADDAVRRVTFQDSCPPDASKVLAFKRRDTRRQLQWKGVAQQDRETETEIAAVNTEEVRQPDLSSLCLSAPRTRGGYNDFISFLLACAIFLLVLYWTRTLG